MPKFILGSIFALMILLIACNSQDNDHQALTFVTVTPAENGAPPGRNPANQSTPESISFLATPTLTPTATPIRSLGQVMVLEYHSIGAYEDYLQRSVEGFRNDMERLHELGYTPANLVDMINGFPNLPPGAKPVVITFDDSDISQFRYLEDGSIDPDTAVGVLYDLHQQYPEDWPLRGTFYVLIDVDGAQRILFGQPEYAQKKLRWLVDSGFEVASHTVSHFDLATGSDLQVQYQLGESQRLLEEKIPDYDVQSFAVPYGSFPYNRILLQAGEWEGKPYTYTSNVLAWGGPTLSPYDPDFDPFYIARIVTEPDEVASWFNHFEGNPELYYTVPGNNTSPETTNP